MTQNRQQLKLQKTLGDGNCAFNSEVRAIARKEVFEGMEQNLAASGMTPDQAFPDFIAGLARALDVSASWQDVTTAMLSLEADNSPQLQRRVSPFLRQFAIQQIRLHRERYYDGYENALVASFDNDAEDDIFIKHRFIKNKFKEIRGWGLDEDETKTQLKAWWRKEGFDFFLGRMADNKAKYWAGELELIPINDYLGINFFVIAPRFGHHPISLNAANGFLPVKGRGYELSYEQVNELIARKIIDSGGIRESNFDTDTVLRLRSLSEAQLMLRLGAVPDYENVAGYLLTHKPAARTMVPDEWEQETREELRLRGIITKDRDGNDVFANHYTSDTRVNEALVRMQPLENKEAVAAVWKQHYRNVPVVILSNPYAVHWSSTIDVKRKAEASVEKSPFVENSPTFFPDKKGLINRWKQFEKALLAKVSKQEEETGEERVFSLEEYIRKYGMDASTYLKQADIRVSTKDKQEMEEGDYILYKLGNTEIVVDRPTQELLDQEFAKKLQAEFMREEGEPPPQKKRR